ncbi:hypothetical protein AF335_25635 [Streptomyces eurocidicus]|uniref:Uncharacterized protein n=1 Tax=Streptomyces eurocidicus TaxID=66423 RepID=A0A2N8NRM0_STREU|nr:hypothetical protein AF335_25635 [Streptomyces eurocidicus]
MTYSWTWCVLCSLSSAEVTWARRRPSAPTVSVIRPPVSRSSGVSARAGGPGSSNAHSVRRARRARTLGPPGAGGTHRLESRVTFVSVWR